MPKKIGVFLDVESTDLSYTQDKLIDLGMVKFEHSNCGHIDKQAILLGSSLKKSGHGEHILNLT